MGKNVILMQSVCHLKAPSKTVPSHLPFLVLTPIFSSLPKKVFHLNTLAKNFPQTNKMPICIYNVSYHITDIIILDLNAFSL